MKKQLVALTMAVYLGTTLWSGGVVAAPAEEAPKVIAAAPAAFDDVKADAWFAESVDYAYQHQLMQGVAAHQFAPHQTVNRAMVMTVLYRLAGTPEMPDSNWGYPFADVSADSYYTEAVYWGRLQHLVSGISAERFAPDSPITREQLAAMLYRYAQWQGKDVSVRHALNNFNDNGIISDYAKDSMSWAVAVGLLQGVKNEATGEQRLMPQASATRAQLAAVLMRFDQYMKA